MQTDKAVEVKVSGTSAAEIVRQIATAEKKYQEDLNRGFAQLNEGVFKGLRRQLPVTRQRVEWDKVGAYRVSAAGFGVPKMEMLTFDSLGRISAVDGHGRQHLSDESQRTSNREDIPIFNPTLLSYLVDRAYVTSRTPAS